MAKEGLTEEVTFEYGSKEGEEGAMWPLGKSKQQVQRPSGGPLRCIFEELKAGKWLD